LLKIIWSFVKKKKKKKMGRVIKFISSKNTHKRNAVISNEEVPGLLRLENCNCQIKGQNHADLHFFYIELPITNLFLQNSQPSILPSRFGTFYTCTCFKKRNQIGHQTNVFCIVNNALFHTSISVKQLFVKGTNTSCVTSLYYLI
jgi:hypothetical protein